MAVFKTKRPSKKTTHPKYNEMIAAAIVALKEKGGSSRLAILKYITDKYQVSDHPNVVNSKLKIALKKGVVSGMLSQSKGIGASGSFKLKSKPQVTVKKSGKKVLKSKATKSKKPKSNKKVAKPKADSKKSTKKAATKKHKSPKKIAKPKADSKKPIKKSTTKKHKSPKKLTKKSAMKAAKSNTKKATKKPTKK